MNGVIRVKAPAFEALLTLEGGICVRCDSPLEWTLGQDANSLREAFVNRRWTATILRPMKESRDGCR